MCRNTSCEKATEYRHKGLNLKKKASTVEPVVVTF